MGEHQKLWSALRQSETIYQEVLDLTRQEDVQLKILASRRSEMLRTFSKLCVEQLKTCFLHPLLRKLQLITEFCETSYRHLPDGQILTKLDIILADMDDALLLKQGILERQGIDAMANLAVLVQQSIQSTSDFPVDYLSNATEFIASINEVRVAVERVESPSRRSFALLYPIYLEVMTSDSYYLSDIELRIICRCARQSVVICRHDPIQHKLTYVSHNYEDDREPISIAIIVACRNR